MRSRSGPSAVNAEALRPFDLTGYSFAKLERRQYLTPPTPMILAISEMTRRQA